MKTEMERFWSFVQVADDNCWEWQGAKRSGYGVFGRSSTQTIAAHRWAYEFCIGRIEADYHIHHVCENRSCVNPKHMMLVTLRQHISLSPNHPAMVNAKKSFCKNGHPLFGDNCRIYKGKRCCRSCLNDWQKKHNRRINGHSLKSAALAQWSKLTAPERTIRAKKGWETRKTGQLDRTIKGELTA